MEQALAQRRLRGATASCSPHCSESRSFCQSHLRPRQAKRQCLDRLITCGRAPANRERAKYAMPSIDLTLERPWANVLPSLDDFAREGWELKVKDWPAFWEMVQRWFEYESDTSTPEWELNNEIPTAAQLQYQDPDHEELVKARRQYYEQWFLIRDREQVMHAINIVAATVDELSEAGVPMPDRLAYLDPIGKFFHARRGRQAIYVQPVFVPEPEEQKWEYPEKPWEEWDDFGFRVHMEKVRIKEEKNEAFQRRLDEVGKYQHMEVTPETDLRLAKQQPEDSPSVDMSHEEIMNLITKNGTCVDPFDVPVDIEDPLSIPDVISEVRWHPETEDYIKELGHWVESEEDLDGMQEPNDATMSDQFDNLGDAFDKEGGVEQAGASGVDPREEDEPTETAAMDSEFA